LVLTRAGSRAPSERERVKKRLPPPRKSFMTLRKNRGYSLLEMMIVLAVIIILSSFAVFRMQTVLNQAHLDTAYDTTLSTLRNTRNLAIAQSYQYIVTFNPGAGTIQVLWQPPMPSPPAAQVCPATQVAHTYTLPGDITYGVRAGFPTAAASVPDGFGTGAAPVDFGYLTNGGGGGSATVVFMPDGSIRDNSGGCAGLGNYSSGVIYLTRAADTIYASRAITVWGTTGRVRGWQLTQPGGPIWVQQ